MICLVDTTLTIIFISKDKLDRMQVSVIQMLFLLTIYMISWNRTNTQSYENMTKLKGDLFAVYDKDIIPVLNQSHMMNIHVTFSLVSIPEVNIVDSFITLTALLFLSWTDEKLTWSPADYGGIQQFSVPVDKVWIPTIILGNGVTLDNIAHSWHTAVINNTGLTSVALGGTFKSFCRFSMAFWPFDKQACNFNFVPVDHGFERMKFLLAEKPVHEKNFIQMGEWTYDQISAISENRFEHSGNDVIYTIKIRRQSAFYLLTIILPIYCVSALGLLVFTIPCESGERIGFAITITLSMAVFLMVVKDEVPRSSEPLPYICVYIIAQVFAAFIINIINIFSLRLFHRNEAESIGKKYKFLVNLVSCFRRRKFIRPEKPTSAASNRHLTHSTSVSAMKVDGVQAYTQNEKNDPDGDFSMPKHIQHACKPVSWKDVSDAVDQITLWTVAPLAVLSTVIGYVYLPTSSDYPGHAN